MLGGIEVPARPNIGIFTQPLSFVGLPVVAAPVFGAGSLPVGIQVIAEGIETEHMAEVCLDCGCNLGQGFLYGRPTSALQIFPPVGDPYDGLGPG